MPHETELIALIAAAFVAALVLGYLVTRVGLPPLVGYLLAGVAIGPFTPGFVADSHLAQQLSEIGVILLMFGVGLHFSLDTLWKVRRIALPGAVVQILVATGIGSFMAWLWGWSFSAGLVFGLALSVASTVVLLRALEQRNELTTDNGRIAVGWLIIEDIAMIIALVLLPVLAVPEGSAPPTVGELAEILVQTLVKVSFFVALMLVGGRRIVPFVLSRIARTGSRELFTLAVLAIALGIAYGSALLFDVSFALGAFFAGVLLAETDLSHEAAEKSLPLQDAFAVLFFVSVGMLADPSIVLKEPLAVLAVLFVVVVGKSIAAFMIVLVFGYPVRTALTISASLAQIGEFSFILVGIGVSLGVLMPEARELILAGALLSITLNPFVFATIEPAARWIGRLGNGRWLAKAAGDSAGMDQQRLRQLRGHAVIVGYGRVGSLIGEALTAEGQPFAVIERNPRVFDKFLRQSGIPAIAADAAAEGSLDRVNIAAAGLLVIASPDGYYARQVLALARERNPKIATVVRTHSAEERAYLMQQGVDVVIMGESELAMAMIYFVLRKLGVDDDRADARVEVLRDAH